MKNKLKISEHDFKNYLLNHYVDEEGNKVSDRVLWSTQEFFDYTGMYAVNKFTEERQICSTGTISYWKKKLELKEEDIYDYHKNITKKNSACFNSMYFAGFPVLQQEVRIRIRRFTPEFPPLRKPRHTK